MRVLGLKVWLGDGGMVGCVCCRVLQEWCVTTLLALSVSLPAYVSHPHKHTQREGGDPAFRPDLASRFWGRERGTMTRPAGPTLPAYLLEHDELCRVLARYCLTY